MKHAALACLLVLLHGCALSHRRDGGDGSVPSVDAGPTTHDAGPITPAGNGVAVPTCGPADGPAWAFITTESPVDCSVTSMMTLPPGTSTVLLIWSALDDGATERTFSIGGFGTDSGSLEVCTSSSAACRLATSGTIVIERFTAGSEVVARWSATLDDGTTTQGRARVTTFCPALSGCGG